MKDLLHALSHAHTTWEDWALLFLSGGLLLLGCSIVAPSEVRELLRLVTSDEFFTGVPVGAGLTWGVMALAEQRRQQAVLPRP